MRKKSIFVRRSRFLGHVSGETSYGNLQMEDGIEKDGLIDAYDHILMVNMSVVIGFLKE